MVCGEDGGVSDTGVAEIMPEYVLLTKKNSASCQFMELILVTHINDNPCCSKDESGESLNGDFYHGKYFLA